MIDELRSASNRLRAALDHYVRICSQVQDVCLQGLDPENVTSDYIEQVDRELGLIESYDVKMQLAKTAIKVTRNYALDAVPINRFPIELLGRIFEMARDVEPRCIDEVVLVCSRWRNIALTIPSLWTRIDLHPSLCKSFYPSLNRAQSHISRSSTLPLDIHISALPEPSPNGLCTTEGYHENSMVGLCAVAAPRVGSLELNLQEFNLNDLSNANYPAIASLFLKCSPGSFTKIVTSCGFFGFFVSDREQTNAGMWTMKLSVEHAHLETVLASVNVLDLTGLYPPWTSRAYHDLVELRLTGSSVGQSSIPEWQLINILKSSPKLRVLLSNINVTSRIAEYLDVSVSLPDLEMLQVDAEPVQENKFGHLELVRFIVPGPRPLNLVLQCADMQLSESSWEHTKAFLERANVEKLYLDSVRHPLSLLPSTPHLKTLILAHCMSFPLDQPEPVETSGQQDADSTMYPRLNLCAVVDSPLSLNEFKPLAQHCRVRSLRVYRNRFYRDIQTDRQEIDTETVMRELSEACPDIKIAHDVQIALRFGDLAFNYDFC